MGEADDGAKPAATGHVGPLVVASLFIARWWPCGLGVLQNVSHGEALTPGIRASHKAVAANTMHLFFLSAILMSVTAAASVRLPLSFRIYDFNIKTSAGKLVPGEKPWSDRKVGVIGSIKNNTDNLVSLVGLQEARSEQLRDIMEGLGPGWDYFGKGDGGDSAGEYCPIIYKTDDWELLNGTTTWLSKTPDKPSKGYGSKYERIVTFGTLRHRATGRTVAYFNTHLDPHNGHARLESVHQIIHDVNDVQQGIPVFLSGDFNSRKTSAPYKYVAEHMTAALTAADPAGKKNKDESTNSGFRDTHPKTIDFIFYQDHGSEITPKLYEVLSSKLGKMVYSDHFPVVADFTI